MIGEVGEGRGGYRERGGCGGSEEVPPALQLPFGKDAVAKAREYAEMLLTICGEWKGPLGATDFD